MQNRAHKAPTLWRTNLGNAKSSNQVMSQEVGREPAHDGLLIALISLPGFGGLNGNSETQSSSLG
jgi:hypothetical protein